MKKLLSTIITLSLCSTVVSSEKPSDQKKEAAEKKPTSQKNVSPEQMTRQILTSMNESDKFNDLVGNVMEEYGLRKKSKL